MKAAVVVLAATGCLSKPARPGGDPGDRVAYTIAFDATGVGMRESNETVTPPLDPAAEQIHLGGFNSIDGMLDEVRISKTGRSADYVAAQYRSMTRAFATVSRAP